MTNLAAIHAMLPRSRLLNISPAAAQELAIRSIGSDSRQISKGELFVALSGERFNAHQFLDEVHQAGASAALISESEKCPADFPAVCVSNTRSSLGELAQAWRSQYDLPLAIVTGSNGKTTVKEMIAAIFKVAVGDAKALATQGNFNNDIGLPLTLLRLRPAHTLAVIELGMNHPGETAQLATLAQATIAIINNAQREHQEFMGSVNAVAEEHAAVLAALPANGTAVFPADSEFTPQWRRAAHTCNIIDFALQGNTPVAAAVMGRLLEHGALAIHTAQGEIEVRLATLGHHQLCNALAATAVGLAAGVDLQQIQRGLENFTPVAGRMAGKWLSPTRLLIDDSYNANPDSVRAAIDMLQQSGKESWLVLGDMGEVGTQGPEFHREVGAYAAACGVSRLFAIGEQSAYAVSSFNALEAHAKHFVNMEDLCNTLNQQLALRDERADLQILVKGSRFMRMERVVQALLQEAKACS
ncbi:UDP-N-acetylmuramoyl-tripeptide--D-alanyl-D-alanine ligase [Polynucleobacter sp. IMCC 29146]|uniref:UDP-N-acetylmuramoyl-tripeptide--D-alanyl-D- alanine ligase n=1 Tax=unclassified Polynucleobacter TaxID=2640945 RepID=UPI00351D3AB2|nr:UDP-N-acetylmuramoyl-tripeptide--D-alanyl-D-alanine ligase [Polynucleobacter sp. IMCC 29146]